MGESDCEQCRVLLKAASRAIIAHASAISRMEEAVSSESTDSLELLEAVVRAASATRESAAQEYTNHRTSHEFKLIDAVYGAGSTE
jgi:hypothetical protein